MSSIHGGDRNFWQTMATALARKMEIEMYNYSEKLEGMEKEQALQFLEDELEITKQLIEDIKAHIKRLKNEK